MSRASTRRRCLIGLVILLFANIMVGLLSISANLAPLVMRPAKNATKKSRLVYTGSSHDLFATGNSCFCVLRDEQMCLVKAGRLTVNEFGTLSLKTTDGVFPVEPSIYISNTVKAIRVDELGVVRVTEGTEDAPVHVGQMGCVQVTAGTMLDVSIGSVFTPAISQQLEFFGPDISAFVITGWAVDNE